MTKSVLRITLILPSLSPGGLEKVLTELSIFFSEQKNTEVYILCLSKGELFYLIPNTIHVVMPPFSINQMIKPLFIFKLTLWLRNQIKLIKPTSLLSFGGRYNSFVLISCWGLHIQTYISDRSRPSISYGFFLNILNKYIYRKADGIIAQTMLAKEIIYNKTNHSNIKVIGNPLKNINNKSSLTRENIVLNVGRFIPSKNQDLLLDYFIKIRPTGWKLMFIGNGIHFEKVRKKAEDSEMKDKIVFIGVTKNIEYFYSISKIFAFTSVSEGFPNVLVEAMAFGLACISFDCEAGPSDLISDGLNGYLVKLRDHNNYILKLRTLIHDEKIRTEFANNGMTSISKYSINSIGNEYYKFITNT